MHYSLASSANCLLKGKKKHFRKSLHTYKPEFGKRIQGNRKQHPTTSPPLNKRKNYSGKKWS